MPSMTGRENHMMVVGTFVYSSLSPERVEMLFNDFEKIYSKQVRNDTNFSYLCYFSVNDVPLTAYTPLDHRSMPHRKREPSGSGRSKSDWKILTR